ncbi:diguanylate cyclase domain-containing protein [Lysinibacillus telephonicus]|uniref:Diguanylate cyclase n=2 Tax=Lysinibacillus telephonicus TaxID=1714840 RepID=A0A431UR37_9BACI|nr:diguanylate cyclase [Lysinibacillus telephonicus]RTQ92743.1 diguanylate cyclase [Lysinibacillus telephonicus]
MKQIKSKINVTFSILFFLILLISSFEVYNIFQTYENNRNLQSKSVKIVNTVYQLETLTFKLNFLGHKHILTNNYNEMDYFNKEIESTHLALDNLINDISLNLEKGERDAFIEKWKSYWIIFNRAMQLSRENNDIESQNWLMRANSEFEDLNLHYLQPLEDDYYNSFSKILNNQNRNFERLILDGIIMLILSVLSFIFAFFYLQKVIKESLALKKRLEFLAYHDELTGIANRRMFQQQVINEIEGSDGKFALMYMDMDKFKYINDNFGHDIGDMVLIAFSKRIERCIRNTDVIGRQGGDEFTVLLKDISEEKVVDIANRILHAFKKPISIGGQYFHITTSIGIAIYPTNGKDYLTLLKHSDDALYEAKKKRNTFVISNLTIR